MSGWVYKVKHEVQKTKLFCQFIFRISRSYRDFNQIILISQLIHEKRQSHIWHIQKLINEIALTHPDPPTKIEPVLFEDVWEILMSKGEMLLKGPNLCGMPPTAILFHIRNQFLDTHFAQVLPFQPVGLKKD